MSARDIGGMLERFNATDGRGDVLSISREDAARLHELPLEIYGPIFHALLGWFLTGKETHLDDPRDRAMLAGFKEHQLGNAARRGKFLNDQKEKSDKAVQARRERTHGTSTDNPRDTQVKDKAKAEDKDEVSKSLSSVDGAERDGLKPPVCPSLSVTEAKKILAMDAPEISSHKGMQTSSGRPNDQGLKFHTANADKAMLMVATAIYPNALDEIGDDAADTLQSVLDGEDHDCYEDWDLPKSFHKTPIGGFLKSAFSISDEICKAYSVTNDDTSLDKMESVFKRALVAALIDSQDPKVENPAAFIITRLKNVLKAVKVLECAKSEQPKGQKPLSESDY